MKKLLYIFLGLSLMFGCLDDYTPAELEYNKKFGKFLNQIDDEFNLVGEWDVSPTGDSLWKSHHMSYNYNIMRKAQKNMKPINDSISEMLFKSRKYDSIPYPNEYVMDRHNRLIKKQSEMIDFAVGVLDLINLGAYDYNGNKL